VAAAGTIHRPSHRFGHVVLPLQGAEQIAPFRKAESRQQGTTLGRMFVNRHHAPRAVGQRQQGLHGQIAG
jgi:hypothetical protein